MTHFLRRNWTIRGDVVTSVYKIVLCCFIASKKTKNYHLLWFLVTITAKEELYLNTHRLFFDNYRLFFEYDTSVMCCDGRYYKLTAPAGSCSFEHKIIIKEGKTKVVI